MCCEKMKGRHFKKLETLTSLCKKEVGSSRYRFGLEKYKKGKNFSSISLGDCIDFKKRRHCVSSIWKNEIQDILSLSFFSPSKPLFPYLYQLPPLESSKFLGISKHVNQIIFLVNYPTLNFLYVYIYIYILQHIHEI